MQPRPLLFAYQLARLGTAQAEIEAGRKVLEQFAQTEGYTLKEIFIETDANHPTSAMAALIAASRYANIQAIAVPSAKDLGRFTRVQQLTKQRLEHEAHVPVLIVQP